MSQRCETTVTIINRLGLHARPAMSLVDVAAGFTSSIVLERDGQCVDGKSIMQVMMLAATKGTKIKVIANGDDAAEACAAIEDIVARGFDED